ncbi:hypothetical protein CGRA01v4_00662 [Colletotrichum graminicola]|nr:hypothetical protein CGRA01v4_00662 [Colletotrichum graminicola]
MLCTYSVPWEICRLCALQSGQPETSLPTILQ